jgi:UDP-N-acetylmuramoylalanine-D-glutamate ligase
MLVPDAGSELNTSQITDRHGSMADYAATKLRIFQHMTVKMQSLRP